LPRWVAVNWEGLVASTAGKPELLINPSFARLWAGHTLSGLGDIIFETTLVVWIAAELAEGRSWSASGLNIRFVGTSVCDALWRQETPGQAVRTLFPRRTDWPASLTGYNQAMPGPGLPLAITSRPRCLAHRPAA